MNGENGEDDDYDLPNNFANNKKPFGAETFFNLRLIFVRFTISFHCLMKVLQIGLSIDEWFCCFEDKPVLTRIVH